MQPIGILLASKLCKHYIATDGLLQGTPAETMLAWIKNTKLRLSSYEKWQIHQT